MFKKSSHDNFFGRVLLDLSFPRLLPVGSSAGSLPGPSPVQKPHHVACFKIITLSFENITLCLFGVDEVLDAFNFVADFGRAFKLKISCG